MNKKIKAFIVATLLIGMTVLVGAKIVNGSTGIIPQTAALFQAQLSSGLAQNGTSMTLSSDQTQLGTFLSNGYYSFVIDQGTPQVEIVEGNLVGDSVTGLVRGLDPQNPNVTSSALMYPHSAGAYVQITVYSWLQHISRILQGLDTEPYSLTLGATAFYTSHPTSTASTTIEDKNYMDNLAIAGAPNGSPTVKGLYQEATTSTIASGTTVGSSGADLALSQNTASTTAQPFSVVETKANGTLDPSFVSGTAYTFTNAKISINTATSTATNTDNFNLLPAGVVQMYASSTAPAGWLNADGSSYATSSYPRLFAVIGYQYGGSGSTFSVPNFASRQPIGIGQGTYTQSVASTSISGSDITIAANDSIFTGTSLTFTETVGSLPSALATGTTYYAVSQSGTDIRLATSTINATNGGTFSLGNSGSSTMIMTVSYTNRALGATGGEETHVQNANELVRTIPTSDSNSGSGAPGSGTALAHNGQAGNLPLNSIGNSVAAPIEDPYLSVDFIIKY